MIYLACPYSHPDPNIVEFRYRAILQKTADMLNKGILVFSPVVYAHPIAKTYNLPGDWEFWKWFDLSFLEMCNELHVLTLDGWEESRGVQAEIEYALDHSKKISYVDG